MSYASANYLGQHAHPESLIQRGTASRLFGISFVVHVVAITLIAAYSQSMHTMSRDSYWYVRKAEWKAETQYATGDIDWSLWIDSAWPEFSGLVFYLFGPQLVIILLINAAFASAAVMLVYQIATTAFSSNAIGKAAAYVLAFFPSFVYYTSMPLKEAPAIFAVLSIVWGVMTLVVRRKARSWLWITVGLLIVAGLRVYLVPVFIGCVIVSLFSARMNAGFAGLVQLGMCMALLGAIGYVLLVQTDIEFSDYEALQYFNPDKLNEVRTSLARGNTRLYESRSEAAFTDNWLGNIYKFFKGFVIFILSVDITKINRARQLAAVPEMLFFLYCLPYLYHGVVTGWKTIPHRILPIIVFGVAILLVYGSATTNAGTMYRWRLQGLPFLIMIVIYGASVRRKGLLYTRLLARFRSRQRFAYSSSCL